jgi:hypothetical protein
VDEIQDRLERREEAAPHRPVVLGPIAQECPANGPEQTHGPGRRLHRALRRQILTEAPRPPREQAPDVPPELDRLCVACLAKDPAQRPASTLALAAGLRACLGATAAEGASAGGSTPGGLVCHKPEAPARDRPALANLLQG